MQRARVPAQRQTAERIEARGVSACHRQRTVHAHRAGPVHGMAEHPIERRLKRKRAVAVERDVGDAKARGEVEFDLLGLEQLARPIKLEPAAPAEMALGARLGCERIVLGDGACQEGPHDLRGFDETRGLRGCAKRQKPRRDLGQEPEVIVGQRGTLQRNPRKLGEACRKGSRENRIALDNARVAVGRALPGLAAVDERHGEPALDQMKRDRGADDTGSKHDNVTARQENLRCG